MGQDNAIWKVYETSPHDLCDVCQCLEGFSPKSPQQWKVLDWRQGCVQPKPLSYKESYMDQFVNYLGLEVQDTAHTWMDENVGLEEYRNA